MSAITKEVSIACNRWLLSGITGAEYSNRSMMNIPQCEDCWGGGGGGGGFTSSTLDKAARV